MLNFSHRGGREELKHQWTYISCKLVMKTGVTGEGSKNTQKNREVLKVHGTKIKNGAAQGKQIR